MLRWLVNDWLIDWLVDWLIHIHTKSTPQSIEYINTYNKYIYLYMNIDISFIHTLIQIQIQIHTHTTTHIDKNTKSILSKCFLSVNCTWFSTYYHILKTTNYINMTTYHLIYVSSEVFLCSSFPLSLYIPFIHVPTGRLN